MQTQDHNATARSLADQFGDEYLQKIASEDFESIKNPLSVINNHVSDLVPSPFYNFYGRVISFASEAHRNAWLTALIKAAQTQDFAADMAELEAS